MCSFHAVHYKVTRYFMSCGRLCGTEIVPRLLQELHLCMHVCEIIVYSITGIIEKQKRKEGNTTPPTKKSINTDIQNYSPCPHWFTTGYYWYGSKHKVPVVHLSWYRMYFLAMNQWTIRQESSGHTYIYISVWKAHHIWILLKMWTQREIWK